MELCPENRLEMVRCRIQPQHGGGILPPLIPDVPPQEEQGPSSTPSKLQYVEELLKWDELAGTKELENRLNLCDRDSWTGKPKNTQHIPPLSNTDSEGKSV